MSVYLMKQQDLNLHEVAQPEPDGSITSVKGFPHIFSRTGNIQKKQYNSDKMWCSRQIRNSRKRRWAFRRRVSSFAPKEGVFPLCIFWESGEAPFETNEKDRDDYQFCFGDCECRNFYLTHGKQGLLL